jgi:hypothetical protein
LRRDRCLERGDERNSRGEDRTEDQHALEDAASTATDLRHEVTSHQRAGAGVVAGTLNVATHDDPPLSTGTETVERCVALVVTRPHVTVRVTSTPPVTVTDTVRTAPTRLTTVVEPPSNEPDLEVGAPEGGLGCVVVVVVVVVVVEVVVGVGTVVVVVGATVVGVGRWLSPASVASEPLPGCLARAVPLVCACVESPGVIGAVVVVAAGTLTMRIRGARAPVTTITASAERTTASAASPPLGTRRVGMARSGYDDRHKKDRAAVTMRRRTAPPDTPIPAASCAVE